MKDTQTVTLTPTHFINSSKSLGQQPNTVSSVCIFRLLKKHGYSTVTQESTKSGTSIFQNCKAARNNGF